MNLLKHEKSPYLKQHANNPVNWHAWNEETLKKARHEDKMLLISIGYSTCHWCHVMERESFELDEVAAVMNQGFINVKVDREERPDVDDYYMDSIHLMGLNGGWPLNCIALPDGRPIWGGTYVPKQKWIETLMQLINLFKNDRQKMEEYAMRINNGLKQMNLIEGGQVEKEFELNELVNWTNSLKSKFDTSLGGMKRAPKFPMPDVYRFLLRQYTLSGDVTLLNQVNKTAIKMAHGGLFDQIGGGFSRYSVDAEWFVPHFEKMLYDNGQLMSLFSELYALSPNSRLKEVLGLTVDFIESDLTDVGGAFYCGLDADSDGEEGKFYVFREDELNQQLNTESARFKEVFQIGKAAHWEEGKNVLRIAVEFEDVALSNSIQNWPSIRANLVEYRSKRIHPGLDDKVLISWNALTIIGLLDVAALLGMAKPQQMALKSLNFLIDTMMDERGDLFRVYHSGTRSIHAFLDDYALLCSACIKAFEVSQQREYLHVAKQLIQKITDKFSDEKSPLFFSTAKDSKNVNVRKINYQDNVIPSANAVFAECLYKMGRLTLNPTYIQIAKKMVNVVRESMARDIEFFSYWGRVYQLMLGKFFEIVVTGPDSKEFVKEINQWFLPGKVIAIATKNDELLLCKNKYSATDNKIYLCQEGLCHSPLTSLKEVEKSIWALP